MSESLAVRLDELEIRFSHQAHQIDELNDVVADCNLQIHQLQRENKQLREMLKNLQPLMEESPDE